MKKTTIAIGALAMLMSGFAATEAVAGPENKCKACHTFDQGGRHKNGPNLFGIVGAKAGSTDFKKYSKSLKNGNWVWDETNLSAWVCNSKSAIKDLTGDEHAKTRMGKQKKCGEKAAAVVAFLNTLK
ncbi:MAG: c-type cytochrome [Mariprofundus sp.]